MPQLLTTPLFGKPGLGKSTRIEHERDDFLGRQLPVARPSLRIVALDALAWNVLQEIP